MRIAVSGPHCTGKSTLIDEFLRAHPDFTHEPEPYTVLVEDFGEEFSDPPCVEDFYRQLEFNVECLRQHARGERVIYERCPIDFLAYIDALDSDSTDMALTLVSDAIQHLDLIVYLPLDENDTADCEYPKLRKAVDRRLSAIFREDRFGIVSANNAIVVEASGSTPHRLRIIEESMNSLNR
jgi:predicted ATPase